MPRTSQSLPALIVSIFLLGTAPLASSRPVTPTGLPMKIASASTTTNAAAYAHWHTIYVSPAPGTPQIHFRNKLNPIWWLENADDPVPPAWYLPSDPHRGLKWRFRNPFHNFDHYVIGVADKHFRRSGFYPERNSNPNGGWDFEIARRKLVILLPFISYERPGCTFYFGWREHGAFGIKLNFSRKH